MISHRYHEIVLRLRCFLDFMRSLALIHLASRPLLEVLLCYLTIQTIAIAVCMLFEHIL